MFEDLNGKRVLVTGAFGGLGSHFAKVLAAAGAHVALAGRRLDAGNRLAAEIRAAGGMACVVEMDVTSADSVCAAFDRAVAGLGAPLDCVVNNAGVALTRPAGEYTDSDWQGGY